MCRPKTIVSTCKECDEEVSRKDGGTKDCEFKLANTMDGATRISMETYCRFDIDKELLIESEAVALCRKCQKVSDANFW